MSLHRPVPIFQTVLLDRDGVINEKMPEGQYVGTISDLCILEGVPEAIAQLNRAGVHVIVLSNQRGVALGKYTCDDVDRVHETLQKILQSAGAHVDAFFYCPHDKGVCDCRKPLPGLFQRARERFPSIAADSSVMIGDSLSDIQFATSLGIYSVWIEGRAETRKPGSDAAGKVANASFRSLLEATEYLIRHRTPASQSVEVHRPEA